MGEGKWIIPSYEKLNKKLPCDIAKIIYYSSKLLFMSEKSVSEQEYELDIKDDRVSYFINSQGHIYDLTLTFLRSQLLPIMFASFHKRSDMSQKKQDRYKEFYLLYKSKYYEFWLKNEMSLKNSLELLSKTYGEGFCPMYLNFKDYKNPKTNKSHFSIDKFQKLLIQNGLTQRLLYLSEKAVFDVFG
jgi:hypothetical protein